MLSTPAFGVRSRVLFAGNSHSQQFSIKEQHDFSRINQDMVHFSGWTAHKKRHWVSVLASAALALGALGASAPNRAAQNEKEQKTSAASDLYTKGQLTDVEMVEPSAEKRGFFLQASKAPKEKKADKGSSVKNSSYPKAKSVTGKASWYGPGLWGNPTASGQPLEYKKTAAHKSWPFGTCVRVLNRDNGETVRVRINDRGPYVSGRIIDLNERAARAIDMIGSGVANVRLKRIPESECKGPDYQN